MAESNIFKFTTPGILAFPVLTPEQMKRAVEYYERQKAAGKTDMRIPSWELSLILGPSHPDLENLKEVMSAIADEHFDPKDTEFSDTPAPSYPLKNGTRMADKRAKKIAPRPADREFFRDNVVLVARSKFPVALGGIVNGRDTDFITDEQRNRFGAMFFSGAEALLEVRLAWYKPTKLASGGGVAAFLNIVYVTGKGTPLPGTGNGRVASSAFGGYAGKVTSVNPLADVVRRARHGLDDLDARSGDQF